MSNILQFDHDYSLYSGVAVNYDSIKNPQSMLCAHYHDDYELYFLIEGSRKYFLSNKIHTIQQNQIILIEPKEPHQVTINLNIPYDRYVIYITPKLLSAICKENPSLNCKYKTQVFDLPERIFKQVINLLIKIDFEIKNHDLFSADIIKSSVTELLALIKRNDKYVYDNNAVTESDLRLQSSINYIIENYAEPITLKECADIANISPNYFSNIFSSVTGSSFKEFLNKTRVNRACELLENTPLSIAEISQNVGFTTESYFGYVFKSLKNCSPSSYRKQNISKDYPREHN